MITFRCPRCDKTLEAPPATAGANGWCACGAYFVVPEPPRAVEKPRPSEPPPPPKPVEWKPFPPGTKVVQWHPPSDELDDDFWVRLRAERAAKARSRRAMYRAIVITVIPLLLLAANCVVVPAACQRVKEATQPSQPKERVGGNR